ncbi:MAG: type II toxin-antitoxin system Phd/YefM family antitoxin [Candidatus Aminicenantes bacterium]|nr:type II toxin-antitoxin system Phd/YefM family antitoxin [Candidatus Aminicenantes bacterium]
MDASVVDLRYKMKDILKALDRNESVTILYHGKKKGVITPVSSKKDISIYRHPFFGMTGDDSGKSVETTMEELRGSRY